MQGTLSILNEFVIIRATKIFRDWDESLDKYCSRPKSATANMKHIFPYSHDKMDKVTSTTKKDDEDTAAITQNMLCIPRSSSKTIHRKQQYFTKCECLQSSK